MKTKLILTAWCVCVFSFTNAQSDTSKYRFANITEMGIFAASPRGVGFEITTINGIAIDRQHVIGIGFGIGASLHNTYSGDAGGGYTPIFANYRYYFNPNNHLCPHVTGSLGGVIMNNGGGFYSAISAGFRINEFSFSSGISFMPVYREGYEDWYDSMNQISYRKSVNRWHYPFGFLIKCGFSF